MSHVWPMVPLGELLVRSNDVVEIAPTETYKEVTIRLWGKGVVLRGETQGQAIAATRRFRVKARQFILSRIDARNGAFGVVPDSLDGAIASTDFPAYDIVGSRMLTAYLGWMSKTGSFVDFCRAASEGTTNRVRLKEERFLATPIPLPPLPEQRRIVAKIEELAAKIEEARKTADEAERKCQVLLLSAYHQIADAAPRRPLGDVAPLTRRPAVVDPATDYPGVSVRSFGRGTFHNPPIKGSEITWEKPHLVKAGDILVSNIKAWEGAIAVAESHDDRRYGSHRYLTFVPIPNLATARFLCFHLLTSEGLYFVGEASPGSADRNRTLGSKAMLAVPVPTPTYEQQCWFDRLQTKVDSMKPIRAQTQTELDAMTPSIVDKAFKGEM